MRIFRISFYLLLVFNPVSVCFTQSLNGLWKGAITAGDSLLLYELLITGEDGKYMTGYGQTTFIINGVENVGVKEVKIRRKPHAYQFEDFELVYNNFSTAPRKVKLFADLGLYYDGPFAMLKGSFYTRALELNARTGPFTKGTLWLKKEETETAGTLPARVNEMRKTSAVIASVMPPKDPKEPKTQKPVKETAKATEKPKPTSAAASSAVAVADKGKGVQSEKATSSAEADRRPHRDQQVAAPPKLPTRRLTVVIRDFEVQSDHIVFSVYDNGEIDGDTVSIYVNNDLLVGQLGLSAAAATYNLPLDSIPSDTIQIVLYAENLGRIPPNTGILILQDGDRRFDIGFTGDLSVSPAIRLRRKRPSP